MLLFSVIVPNKIQSINQSSIHQPTFPSIHQPTFPSIHQLIHPSINLSIHPSIHPSINLYIHPGDDCFLLATIAYNSSDFYHSVLWLNESLRRVGNSSENPDQVRSKTALILDYLAYSYYKVSSMLEQLSSLW